MKKQFVFLTILLLASPLYSQQTLTITGVDSSEMLLNGTTHIYVSLGQDLSESDIPQSEELTLLERESEPGEWTEREITDLQFNGVNQNSISFLLLIDNSGSMYETIAAEKTEKTEEQRINFVLKALQELFTSTQDFQDKLSVVSFNTHIKGLSPFTDNRNQLITSLDNIMQPSSDDAYTELYRAMSYASDELSMRKGRKVLILLTDGENYSFSENRLEPHPVYGNELLELNDIEQTMQKRGISVYTIHYAKDPDPDLKELSDSTGGLNYIANSGNELLSAYREIHSRINNEIRLSYKPAVSASRERSVKISLENSGFSPEFNFLWEIFWGLSPVMPWWVYLVFSIIALILVLIIHKTPFEVLYSFPHLEVIEGGDNEKTVIQMNDGKTMIALGREQTQIMNETEFQNKNDDETGITIIKNSDGKYILEADHEIMINNKTVISRELEAGDVIRSEGTMIIFDEAEQD